MTSFNLKSSAIMEFPLDTNFNRVCPQVLFSAKKSILI